MATLDFTGYDIPSHTQGALERYINHGLRPGSFLEAVLSNDLFRAVGAADLANTLALTEIVKWLYNCAPIGCHGSEEKVHYWILDRSAGE